MLALRWHDRRDVRVDEVPEPLLGEHADALIEVSQCGICGTDLAEWRSGPAMIRLTPHPLSGQAPPVTLGHELVGTLVEGSSPDGAIQLGARVTVDACLRCGTCPACQRGDYHMCRYGGSIGLHVDGGFAPLVAVPGYTLVAVPDEVSDEQAALTEPFAVGLHGLERAGAAPGHDVLVLGFGTIGAASALVARALGARPHVVELDAERRAVAERLGLPTIDPGDDLARRVRKSLGDGGADVVVESTGVADVVPLAVECAARGGRVALLGLPSAASTLDARRLTLFERSLIGSLGYRHDLPRVLRMVASGALDPAELVSDRVALADAAQALQDLASAPAGKIKVLVQTGR
ncbi:MAG: (R,R)-butanediol dehydrogenase / meso-butanediol dehydrogenase / diacetyl reductase [Solirubrobacteraceae bacterium]|jgi:(R,R)-butanediol dehydrogenase/meso-butanediol dehydrogenase/diacetyl reductase|nr:(R,R)-butanediol dehydrogenase / meso-butanediol dehydrogenase / diacetyl reductase [Solirubrobacteraceae bacterium]